MKIIGTGHCVPEKAIGNGDLEKFLDTSDEWITTRTGIKNRFVSTGETLCSLASASAFRALKKAHISADELDLIICSTIKGDFYTPSLACTVQECINARCPAFDLNAACSGFIYALDAAEAYLSSGKAKNILIISAETMSKLIDWNDRSTCVLFGDGAGACVVTNGDSLKYISINAFGDRTNLYACSHDGNSPFSKNTAENKDSFLHMNGQEIFKFAVSTIEKETALALNALKIEPDKISYYLLHQANIRIIDFARARLKQPKEKFPVNIDNYGNTSSASIPILLDEMAENGRIKRGDYLLLNAFGAGLTNGTCVIEWQ